MECFDQASFCFENRAQDAPKARQGAPRCPKTPQNSSKITPRRPEDAPRNRPGRLQEAPRRPKTHPRRRKTPARRPKTPPRCDFGGFREPNWNQVGHPRAAQTHVLLSFSSSGKGAKAHQHVTNRFTQQRPGAPERQPRFTDRPRRVRDAKRI